MGMTKLLADPVHGMIELTEMQAELIDQPELQRMAWMLQLGFTKLVFPGANHTRLEHSIGVSYIAGQMAKQLELTKDETKLVVAAGLLHDLGHAPLSHLLEKLLPKKHEQITADIITGKEKLFLPEAGKIPDVLESYGISPQKVADIVTGQNKSYLGSIVAGAVDADRLDYLVRDAYYTGASHGSIGIGRLIKMLQIKDGRICVLEKGVRSIEEMLVARMQMYPAVYWHHAARIAGLMIYRAIEPVIDHIPHFNSLNDFELLAKLRSLGGFQKEIAERIIFRRLYKRAFVVNRVEYPEFRTSIDELSCDSTKTEERIAKEAGIDKKYVIVDARQIGEKIEGLNFPVILRDGKIVDIKEMSPLASGVMKKESLAPIFSVYTPEEYRKKVSEVVKRMIK